MSKNDILSVNYCTSLVVSREGISRNTLNFFKVRINVLFYYYVSEKFIRDDSGGKLRWI